jgi:hypothetical protein
MDAWDGALPSVDAPNVLSPAKGSVEPVRDAKVPPAPTEASPRGRVAPGSVSNVPEEVTVLGRTGDGNEATEADEISSGFPAGDDGLPSTKNVIQWSLLYGDPGDSTVRLPENVLESDCEKSSPVGRVRGRTEPSVLEREALSCKSCIVKPC